MRWQLVPWHVDGLQHPLGTSILVLGIALGSARHTAAETVLFRMLDGYNHLALLYCLVSTA